MLFPLIDPIRRISPFTGFQTIASPDKHKGREKDYMVLTLRHESNPGDAGYVVYALPGELQSAPNAILTLKKRTKKTHCL